MTNAVDATTMDTVAVDDNTRDYLEFAHGTTRESGERIVDNGLSYQAGIAAMFGSREPGSFFTVRVDPSDPYEALSYAASWGTRHGSTVSVVICRLPRAIVEHLEATGALVHVTHPPQSVFRPSSFQAVNHEAQWDIIHVSG